jgi:hypothetical protein
MLKHNRVFREGLILLAISIGTAFYATSTPAEFPIKVSQNGRYFIDKNNRPFFIQSDTPWSLFVVLDLKETEQYLKNRQEKGFNTITVNLIEHWFNGEKLEYPTASMNREGHFPFTQYLPGIVPDLTFPDESYASAAMPENGETFIAYIPKGNVISVDLQRLSGSTLVAWWFNPRNGLSQKIAEYAEKSKIQFTPPDRNDWVLVIDDAAYNFGVPGGR